MSWKLNRRRRGVALIWVALLTLVLIGIVGLALDTAYGLWVGHQLQIAADAAALAGALKVRSDVAQAQQAPRDVAFANWAAGEPVRLTLNESNNPAGDIVVGSYIRTTGEFIPTLVWPNAVKVVARRTNDSLGGPVSLFFGPVFNVRTVNISRWAIAMSGGGKNIGVIALDEHAPGALHMAGNAVLSVDNRGVQVNSDHSTMALRTEGGVVIDAEVVNVTGEPGLHGHPEITGTLTTGAPTMNDPLAYLPPPTWDPINDLGAVTVSTGDAITIQPGFYSGGISMTGGTLTLEPGIYVLDGEGIYIRGNGTFYAEGVMVYITGAGVIDMAGTGDMYLTPPDRALHSFPEADVYEGVSIFQDRSNTNPARIIGTSSMDLNGTLYFPNNHVQLGGTGGSFGNALIAKTVEIKGVSNITIDYDDRFPTPSLACYLVE